MALLLALAAATGVGLAFERLAVPGGLILGAMLGAAVVRIGLDAPAALPAPLRNAAFIAVGAAIGLTISREALVELRAAAVPALLAAVLIIVAGVGIAYLLRALGIAPAGHVLATSPGALSVVSALAAEQGVGAAQVALFHLVRVVLVILTLPLLLPLLRSQP